MTSNKNKFSALLAAAVLSVSLLAAGCGEKKAAPVAEKKVLVVKVGGESLETAANYAATVKSRYETPMAFRVGGQILARYVNEGQRVKRGENLLALDAKDINEKYRAAAAAESSAEAAFALAKANFERYANLVTQGAVSQMAYDNYRTQYEAAAAQRDAAKAQAQEAANALSYTTLTAEADGVVSELKAEAGQVVAAGQTVLTLRQAGELEAEISIPESKLQSVDVGQEARVKYWALGDKEYKAVVREIAGSADAGSRTYRVRLSLLEPPPEVSLGMTASVAFAHNAVAENAAVLPLSAIYQNDDKVTVWVAEDGTVAKKPVKIVGTGKNEVAVTGLNQGDLVVIKGVHRLAEGEKVTPEEKTPAELAP